jgi:hypothetical protein
MAKSAAAVTPTVVSINGTKLYNYPALALLPPRIVLPCHPILAVILPLLAKVFVPPVGMCQLTLSKMFWINI